jgi:hypothetical protein
MIKVRVILEDAFVYKRMDTSGKPLAVLSPGREFNLGRVFKETSEQWVEANLPDGRSGYVKGTTKLRVIYPVITSKSSPLFQSTDRTSTVLADLPAKSRMELVDVLEEGTESWSLVRLPDGREGYLPSEVKFKREEKKKKRSAGQYAVYGSALVLIGIFGRRYLATVSSSAALEYLAYTGIVVGGVLIIYSFFLGMRAEALKRKPAPRKQK